MKFDTVKRLVVPMLMMGLPLCQLHFSDRVYSDLVYYSYYAKLADCVSKPGRLSVGVPFAQGGCSVKFCQHERTLGAVITKIREAPEGETGSAIIVLDERNEEIVVAFRASTTVSDWLSDFMIRVVDYEPISQSWNRNVPECIGCKVHSGFYKDLGRISEDLVCDVLQLYAQYPAYKLSIVGFSLGAALATLTGIEFRARGFQPLVIGYAPPRMFNKEMGLWVNEVFHSENLTLHLKQGGDFQTGLITVVHDEDYVPSLPPNLVQAGVEFFIAKKHLPHTKDSVILTGVDYLSTQYEEYDELAQISLPDKFKEWLHAYEHRTYFITIHKCDDVDQDWIEFDTDTVYRSISLTVL